MVSRTETRKTAYFDGEVQRINNCEMNSIHWAGGNTAEGAQERSRTASDEQPASAARPKQLKSIQDTQKWSQKENGKWQVASIETQNPKSPPKPKPNTHRAKVEKKKGGAGLKEIKRATKVLHDLNQYSG
jgi:hypothetical protein